MDLILDLPAWRASIFQWKHQSIIFDSSYNSSPVGTYHMLDLMQDIREQLPDYGIICLMGEMRELYDLTESAHTKLAHKLMEMNSDYVWLVWESTQTYMLDPLVKVLGQDRVRYSPDSRQLGIWVNTILEQSSKKYIILVKGSQNTIFLEEAVKQLLANSHDTTKLCRQSDWRMIKKKQRFDSIKS